MMSQAKRQSKIAMDLFVEDELLSNVKFRMERVRKVVSAKMIGRWDGRCMDFQFYTLTTYDGILNVRY
jgi:hypothetical protein